MADGKDQAAGIDLDAMNVPELIAHIKAAQAKLQEKQEAAKSALLAKWREEAAEHNLPFEAMLAAHQASSAAPKKPSSGDKLPVKFKGPKGEEWSGRGKVPKWLEEAEKQGQKREEFAV